MDANIALYPEVPDTGLSVDASWEDPEEQAASKAVAPNANGIAAMRRKPMALSIPAGAIIFLLPRLGFGVRQGTCPEPVVYQIF